MDYYYLHTDHLGTAHVATDKTGVATWKVISESFGAMGAIENSVEVSLRFPGQYFDKENQGFYNFRRDYKPNMGRFLQSDPMGLYDGVNLYSYVKNVPILNIDPLGLAVTWKGSISGGGAVYGAGGYIGVFTLESECKCNKKFKITGGVSLLSIGIGASGMPALGGAGSSITMIDNWADCPDPNAATGNAWSSGVNAVFGGGVSIAGTWKLGRLKSEGDLIDKAVGLDLSLSIGMGKSAVKSVVEEKCGECQ